MAARTTRTKTVGTKRRDGGPRRAGPRHPGRRGDDPGRGEHQPHSHDQDGAGAQGRSGPHHQRRSHAVPLDIGPNEHVDLHRRVAKIWLPLLLPKGDHLQGPRGLKGLSTIHVAQGRRQVAFHGAALYHFTGDTKLGQAKGQGIRRHVVRRSQERRTDSRSRLDPGVAPSDPGTAQLGRHHPRHHPGQDTDPFPLLPRPRRRPPCHPPPSRR